MVKHACLIVWQCMEKETLFLTYRHAYEMGMDSETQMSWVKFILNYVPYKLLGILLLEKNTSFMQKV